MNFINRKQINYLSPFHIFGFHQRHYVFKRLKFFSLIITFIYIIIISIAYYIFCQPLLTTLLVPVKRPHDQKFLSEHRYHVSRLAATKKPRDIILVTASSAHFVDRLENLIGSIHFHEPHVSIIIFDLGMTDSQLSRITCMANIQIEIFPFEFYPSHVADLDIFAYKALLLKEVFDKYRSKTKAILYLDAGAELRSSLDPIYETIQTKGYFLTRQKTLIIDYTDDQTFAVLNMSKNYFSTGSHYQTAGGFIGFKTNMSAFYNDILIPFVACSLNKDCIAPNSPRTLSTHRFDQSVLSILVYKNGYQVETDERFYGDFGSADELDETMVIFSRRWHCPKVYASEIVFRRKCNFTSIFRPRYRIRNVHEHADVYTCGKLTVIKFDSRQIELPVYQVYWLLYIIYIVIMISFYYGIPYMLSSFISIVSRKKRTL